MATVFERYPCPASLNKKPTDNFGQTSRPGGGTYKRPDGHGGSDIKPSAAGKIGEPVYPVRGGIVVWVGTPSESSKWGNAYGNRVLIKHDFRHEGKRYTRYSFYAHLDKVFVKSGESVSTRKRIGLMGKTGYTTGPHVHFEWHKSPNWTQGLLDPFPRLEDIRQTELRA